MKIEWNRVTWYSKLLAVIVFVGVFVLAFCLGRQYEKTTEISTKIVSIPEYKMSFEVPESLSDLTYKIDEYKNILLSSKSLEKMGGAGCNTEQSPLGSLSVGYPLDTGYSDALELYAVDASVVLFENNSKGLQGFKYSEPQDRCSDNKAVEDKQNSLIKELKHSLRSAKFN